MLVFSPQVASTLLHGSLSVRYRGRNKSLRASDKVTCLRLYFEAADYHFYPRSRGRPTFKSDLGRIDPYIATCWSYTTNSSKRGRSLDRRTSSRVALIAAEIASLDGHQLEAERVIRRRRTIGAKHGFVQNEGVANQLAAQFHAERQALIHRQSLFKECSDLLS